jgi:hypothetical protein
VAVVEAAVGQSSDSCSQTTLSRTAVSAREYCRFPYKMVPSAEVAASYEVAYS